MQTPRAAAAIALMLEALIPEDPLPGEPLAAGPLPAADVPPAGAPSSISEVAAAAVRVEPGLTTLSISGNPLGMAGLVALGPALQVSHSLQLHSYGDSPLQL